MSKKSDFKIKKQGVHIVSSNGINQKQAPCFFDVETPGLQ